jgi:hypothetical protein
MERVTKFLDKIFTNSIFKNTCRYILVLLLFYYLSEYVNKFIVKYLTIKPIILENIPSLIIAILFIVSFIFTFHLFWLKRYYPSKLIKDFIIIATLIYLLTRFTDYAKEWSYINLKNNFYFIDLFGIISIVILSAFIYYFFSNDSKKEINVPFLSDEPIYSEEDDKMDYTKRADEIFGYIKRLNFKTSFTIGIVGPWGNGKSSLIKLIQNKIENENDSNTIHLKFLPYLNHNEKDIISEFFNQLSVEIKKYNGQLSSEFLDYSDRLLKLYSNRKIIDFLKTKSNSFSSKSSYDTYQKINEILKQLNKKIVIFVDDLDRLNNKETLQVLKLVRNSANFKNFIFLIAIDKDYVLESLTKSNDIVNHKFLDKFFQLEVYLPEIEKEQLKRDFVVCLKKSDLKNESKFIGELQESIYLNTNLFEDYVQNYRDVKRLVNQLVFDHRTLPDKLNTNDFLNFTYLKMSFPSMIKFLGKNWTKIIPYNPDSNLCELLESDEENKSNNSDDLFSSLRRNTLFTFNNNLNIDFNKYEISKDLESKLDIKQNTLSIKQNLLIAKTLIVLFGKENSNETYSSIKFENNFRKLIQQKLLSSDLTENEFKSIFDFENEFGNLKNLLKNNFANDIVNRVAFFNTNNKEETFKVVLVLLYLFNFNEKYNLNSSTIWQVLSKFIKRVIDNKDSFFKDENQRKELWEYIEVNFIDDVNYSLIKKIEFISLISQNRVRIDFEIWGVEESDLKVISLMLYKQLLEDKKSNLWEYNDYSFYGAYHDTKKFHTGDVINPLTIDFWDKNDITLLCAQLTQNDAWTTKMLKTSDYADDLFGSKYDYKKYIDNRINDESSVGLKEYKWFLFLESLTYFKKYIRFDFKDFELIHKKLNDVIVFNNMKSDEFDNIVEVVFESSSKDFFDATRTNVDPNSIKGFITISHSSYENSEIYYTFITFDSSKIHNAIKESLRHFKNELLSKNIISVIDFENKIIKSDNEYIKIISIEPQDYN